MCVRTYKASHLYVVLSHLTALSTKPVFYYLQQQQHFEITSSKIIYCMQMKRVKERRNKMIMIHI